jgi:hypothetical protein
MAISNDVGMTLCNIFTTKCLAQSLPKALDFQWMVVIGATRHFGLFFQIQGIPIHSQFRL